MYVYNKMEFMSTYLKIITKFKRTKQKNETKFFGRTRFKIQLTKKVIKDQSILTEE